MTTKKHLTANTTTDKQQTTVFVIAADGSKVGNVAVYLDGDYLNIHIVRHDEAAFGQIAVTTP